MIKILNAFFVLTIAFSFVKCESLPFQIKEAYYQSWYKSDNEKGTNIIISLSEVKGGVEFDSIVFRGKSLPLATQVKNNTTILAAQLNLGNFRSLGESKVSNKPDQLWIKYKGKRLIYSLNLDRKEMKYYR